MSSGKKEQPVPILIKTILCIVVQFELLILGSILPSSLFWLHYKSILSPILHRNHAKSNHKQTKILLKI